MTRTFSSMLPFLLCLAAALAAPPAIAAPAGGADGPGTVTVRIQAGQYEIVATPGGDEVRMDGFGRLPGEGNPLLPGKIFSIAVPPGAEVTGVAFETPGAVVLDGARLIAPAPRHRILTEETVEQPAAGEIFRSAVYDGDRAFPEAAAAFVRQSGYRKYDLADVQVAPFAWNPKTKRLTYYPEVVVHVGYTVPANAPAAVADNLPRCERTARGIIANYDQAQAWYPAGPNRRRGLHDFVIITLDSLTSSVQPLVDWQTAKGRTAYVATTSWIYANYSGYDEAQKIRNFLRDKYPSAQWGIEDVLFVGRYADVPMRRCWQNLGYGMPETDFYYAELSKADNLSWDSDGDHRWGEDSDSIDFYNEVNVGRIPWSNAATVEHICKKSANFELNGDPGYKRNILLLGSYFWEDTDNAVLMEYKTNPGLHSWMADWSKLRMYEKNHDWSSLYASDDFLVHPRVMRRWTEGRYAVVNWAGHGSPTSCHIMGSGASAFIQASDCSELNDVFPAIIFADACSNSDTDSENIGMCMLRQGAVGFVGATKVALGCPGWTNPNHGSSQSLDYYFTANVTSGGYTQGEALQAALRTMYTNNLWSALRYETFEWAALWGSPDVSVNSFAALELSIPEETAAVFQTAGKDLALTVRIDSGSESYVPGTGALFFRHGTGDAFTQVPLVPLGGGLYGAVMPGCKSWDEPEYYFFAQGDGGTAVTSPPGAPEFAYSFDVAVLNPLLVDDGESDQGWAVMNEDLSGGAWERVEPIGAMNGGVQSAPDEDNPAGAGTKCHVTQNGAVGGAASAADVDGGPTYLVSPMYDLDGKELLVTAYLWHYNDDHDECLRLGMSTDDGAVWNNVWQIRDAEWQRFEFVLNDFRTPSSQTRIRFNAHDNPNNSITEAGVDDVRLEIRDVDPSLCAEDYAFSAAAGCDIDLHLYAPEFAGHHYLVLGSMSGFYPGTELPQTGKKIPVNRDWFTDFVLTHVNNNFFRNFRSTLSGQGKAVATLHIPASAAAPYAGTTMYYAFTTPGSFDYVSNPVAIAIEP